MRQDCSYLSQAEVDDAAWWPERRQSSRYTGSAMLYCQLWTNQIILVQSNKNHPTCSPLSSEHLRTVLKTETTFTNCAHQRCFQRWRIVYFPSVIPKTSLDIFFIFFWLSWEVEPRNYLLPCKQIVLQDCLLPGAVEQRSVNYTVLIR